MLCRIHGGATQVGGSCVELQARTGGRIILDLGLPLDAQRDEVPLPDVPGLQAGGDPSLLGVVLSHGHPDHYGLIESTSIDVPIWAGEGASAILREAAFFSGMGMDRPIRAYLRDRSVLKVGPFKITPYLVDHSAFDAYALLVEADSRRLFYSGDLRGHGRKSSLFERLVKEPPRDIDVALVEGTSIGREGGSPTLGSETEVEEATVRAIRETPGMVLAAYSPQNVDRLVSVYRATARAKRNLVLDLYAAAVAAATGSSSIPQADWDRVRVYVPNSQRVRVKQSGEFQRVDDLGSARIFREELAEDPGRWVMSFRGSMLPELKWDSFLVEARALWMMWPGYLERESGRSLGLELERLGIALEVIHASGHASLVDLQRFVAALDARRVVPIHTDAPERYHEFFEKVEMHVNDDWWEV